MNRLEMLVKGNMGPAKFAQEKLSSAKANLNRKKSELEILQRKRGEESLKTGPNSRRLEYFDDEIGQVKKEIGNIPYEIEVLEGQLRGSKIADAAKKDLYDAFMEKVSIKDIQKKSRLLLKQLKSALVTNEEIQEFHRRRVEVEKNTGRRIATPDICGSFDSLKILVGVCESENNGMPRTFTRWGSVTGEDTI